MKKRKKLSTNQLYIGLFGVAFLLVILFTMVPQGNGVPGLSAQGEDHGDYLQFSELAADPAATPEVVIYFSYTCPHCYNSHDLFYQAMAKLPRKTAVRWVQVPFLPREESMARHMMQAAAIGDYLGQSHELNEVLFSAYHDSKILTTSASIERTVDRWLIRQGSSERFASLVKQPEIERRVEQMRELTAKAPIRGVPAVVVNSQYKLKLEQLSSTEELRTLIGRLLRK